MIKFRNGVSTQVDLASYRKMRDLFWALSDQGFKVEKSEEGFTVTKITPNFRCSVPSLEAISFFNFLLALSKEQWAINQIGLTEFQVDKKPFSFQIKRTKDRLYFAKSDKLSLIGPLESLMTYFLECESGVYDYNYTGKTVLDIGAFCGESAIYFANRGAKKVILYEPVEEHHELIQKNIFANGINAEVHHEGLGDKNESITITYEDTGLGFGLLSKGNNTRTITVKNAWEIIEHSKADIAKIDCEGAEVSLLGLPKETLDLLSFYIIETHTLVIQNSIRKKFLECGFIENRAALQLEGEIYVLYFEKPPLEAILQ